MFSDYFGNNFYSSDRYLSPYEYEMRRQQAEEQRRRAAILQQQRGRQELFRQRQVQEEYENSLNRQSEEERAYRQWLQRASAEAPDEQRIPVQHRRRQQRRGHETEHYRVPARYYENDEESYDNPKVKLHQIVRGPGGRLYQVPAQYFESDREDEIMEEEIPKHTRQYQSKARKSKAHVTEKSVKGYKASPSVNATDIIGNKSLPDEENLPLKPNGQKKGKGKKNKGSSVTKPRRRRITVIVEDASDSEQSDLEALHSAWRNRRPPPGILMEPVGSQV